MSSFARSSIRRAKVALIGARGYTGRELLGILSQHDGVELALATSQKDTGRLVASMAQEPGTTSFAADAWPNLTFAAPVPELAASLMLDAYILALPNGTSEPWVSAIEALNPAARLIDLSSDHRFTDSWAYGQPERFRSHLRGSKRIANPGCYATAAQLALAPLTSFLAENAPPSVFGVSGFSGAGTTPSQRNDPAVLHDNLLPYHLTDHVHERELTRHLGREVFFMPHVASFFRGISCTISMTLREPQVRETLVARYLEAYGSEPLVTFSEASDPPVVRDIVGCHEVRIGGLTVSKDGRHVVVVSTIDNLLGGAATQAVRNLNLSLGFHETRGIHAASH